MPPGGYSNKKSTLWIISMILSAVAIWTLEHYWVVKPLQEQVVELQQQQKNIEAMKIALGHDNDVAFDFGEYKGHPVQLVVEKDGRVTFEVVFPPYEVLGPGDEYLPFMKAKVEEASLFGTLTLRNGMTLKFDGYPIWGPHQEFGPTRSARRLLFGQSATFEGLNTIVVHGEKEHPVGYYPYHLKL